MNKPTGNVTFLFTDIEGSTRLAQEFPDSLPVALEKHHAIMHKVIESNNGFVFEIVGDAFCCAFQNAEDAIKAAVDSQINLANEKWDDIKIKIRIGIHSGNAEWNGKRYMGYITLARTARVMSSAYGEQIIISNDTYELAKEKTPNKISFRDLGERRLKDLKQPVKLFQILSNGLREDFPPLKTLDARPNNLPVQLTSFIGREAEIKTVKDLLKQTHLLTLTGSGGAGKTRLALQIAADVIDDFANGVWFVELASLSEPAFLPQAIMKVFNIKEEPKKSLEDTLSDYLRDKEMLIILDNCEHLVDACSILTEKLLSNCPKLKIIATSREGLRCGGEQTHRVLSLEIPDPKDQDSPEQLSQYEAVRLFIERALAVDSTFRVNNNNAPALAEICFQLDGIPLAIELAAVRTKVLTVEQINERLSDRFNLLTGGKRTSLPRQQTLRALIDWSYDLLSEKEQILWSRLSVFAGGWTLEAAEEVCSDEKISKEKVIELMSTLTEKSIIIFDKRKERYKMLETIKQYVEKTFHESLHFNEIKLRHLHFYMDLAERIEVEFYKSDQKICLATLDEENFNFQIALNYALDRQHRKEGLQLAGSLGKYWEVRGNLSDATRWLEILCTNMDGISESLIAKVLNWRGIFERVQDNYKLSKQLHQKSLKLSIKSNYKKGIARSLNNLGLVMDCQGEYKKAIIYFEKSLEVSKEIDDIGGIASSLLNLSNACIEVGEYNRASILLTETLEIDRKLGNKFGMSHTLMSIGNIQSKLGDLDAAQTCYEEGKDISLELGDKMGYAHTLGNLGIIYEDKLQFEKANAALEEALIIFKELNTKKDIANTLSILGNIKLAQKEYRIADNLFNESLLIQKEIGEKRGIATSLHCLGLVKKNIGNYDEAESIFKESLILLREMDHKRGLASCLSNLGLISFLKNYIEDSLKFYKEAIYYYVELGVFEDSSNCIIGIIEILSKEKKFRKAVLFLGAFEIQLNIALKYDDSLKNSKKDIEKNLRKNFSNKEFLMYYGKGKLLTPEQAVELITEEDDYE